ncbi:MAG: alpha/beta hydrolase [Candidatus Thiodiazotropha sp.]
MDNPHTRKPFAIWPNKKLLGGGSVSSEQHSPLLYECKIVRNVTEPSITPYLPEQPNGPAVVVCPGGAFQFLMIEKEGTSIAEWLISNGITAFVLKYRLAPTPVEDAKFVSDFTSSNFDLNGLEVYIKESYDDGRQAISVIRQRALDYGIDQSKIGIIGFSAGAAGAVSSVFNSVTDSIPAFVGAIYGAPPEMVTIPSQSPPLFVAYANDDNLAFDTCTSLYQSWRESESTVEIHAYSKGGHGFGLFKQGLTSDNWPDAFISWLKSEKLVTTN